MQAAGFRLGIDFGTSHTVAVLRWPDGRAKPLLFDGSPLLPSAVYVDVAGRTVVGRDALDSARMHPSQLEPNPKRRVDDGAVLLGDREVPVADLIGAVLGRVADEAQRTAGEPPAVVTMTCPAAWGTIRRRVLLAAAARAGLGEVRLVEEPVAAATYFIGVLGQRLPVGSAVVVYDFGAGTFDASLVERTASGLRTRAVAGRDDIGGLDLDEAIVRRIGEVYGRQDPDGWRRLAEPTTRHERRQRRLFRDDVRNAKERLSRYPTAEVHIAGLDRDAHVTREEVEQLARPLLDETVRLTAQVAGHGGFPRERIAGVFLVGGTSRVPLVATLVHHGLGIAPTVIEQPELVVAEGSILVQSVVAVARASRPVAPTSPAQGTPSPGVVKPDRVAATAPAPVGAAPSPVTVGAVPAAVPEAVPGEPVGPGRRRPSRRWVVAGTALAVVVAVVVAVAVWRPWLDPNAADAAPAACGLAARATGTRPLDPGLPVEVSVGPPDGWKAYLDESGFRIAYPEGWTTFGGGACFGDREEGRYVAVDQWQQDDADLVAYWTRKESQVADGLTGYRKIGIKTRPDYWDAAADWEFTFDDGAVKMHVLAIALVAPGARGYGYLWVTRDSVWQSNLPDLTRLTGSFRPARPAG